MTDSDRSAGEPLNGSRILVVEDEYMIAEELARELTEAGAGVLGPVPRPDAALRLVGATKSIDIALLDVNLGSETIWPVVDALQALNVPVVLSTGYDAAAIPQAYLHLPRCEKPVSGRELVSELARVLAGKK